MGDVLLFSIYTMHSSTDNNGAKERLSTDTRCQLSSEVSERPRPVGYTPYYSSICVVYLAPGRRVSVFLSATDGICVTALTDREGRARGSRSICAGWAR